MKKKQASSLIYMIFMTLIFLIFCAFAIDGTIIFSDRAKLQNITEASALAGASEFNTYSAISATVIKLDTENIFNALKQDRLQQAKAIVTVDDINKTLTINSKSIAKPYFLSFLGVSGVKISANAKALSTEIYFKANYDGDIGWIVTGSSSGAKYYSSILSAEDDYKNTAILAPIGDYQPASYYEGTKLVEFERINEGGEALSLGPGGFITLKPPAIIIDKEGPEIFIKEKGAEDGGASEGYMVFAGIDNNSDNPYIDSSNTGDDIRWVNISCSGISAVNSSIPTGNAGTSVGSDDTKFYGSAYFNLGASCINNNGGEISTAKYIRIIDDNQETAYLQDSSTNTYKKINLYGEASTATAGADIDSVKLMNYVRLK